jgi:energy-coupling factor transporter ATP-binding protein EcfA2
MDPASFYESRRRQQSEALTAVQARSTRISAARVLTFLLGSAALGAHAFGSASGALPLGLGLLVVFTALVFAHARVVQREEQLKAAVLFCERGLARATDALDKLPPRGDPRRFRDHPYASDLDLLGERSLLARLDAMETEPSESLLTSWLLQPAPPEEVRARQQAVQELTPRSELREALFVHARPVATKNPDLPKFLAWSAERGPSTGGLTALGLGLPLATAVLFFGGATLGLPPWAWGVTAALQWVLTPSLGALGASGLDEASRGAAALGAFSGVLGRLRAEQLTTPRLASIEQALAQAEPALRRLEFLASWAEARENGLFRLMVGPAVMYDLHLWLALERWRKAHGAEVKGWVTALTEALALAGLATHAFDNPEHTFPELQEGPPRLSAVQLAHPLLPRSKRVANDVTLNAPGHGLLITGSNMSGKSTLLRAMGIAVVLAQAGAPVAARRFELTPLRVRTSIRISDSLASGYSHFYAELLALKRVVDEVNDGPVFFLLDEILHGTNSRERQIGAVAVVDHLLRKGALGAVTTHDLGLAELVDRLPGQVRLVHFQEQHEGDQMTFDYRLRDGLLRSGNALALMRQLGLPVLSPHTHLNTSQEGIK